MRSTASSVAVTAKPIQKPGPTASTPTNSMMFSSSSAAKTRRRRTTAGVCRRCGGRRTGRRPVTRRRRRWVRAGSLDGAGTVTVTWRPGLIGRRPGTVRRRRRRCSTRAVDDARSAAWRSVASYRRTSAGARASRPAAARTARSTEVGTLTPPVSFGRPALHSVGSGPQDPISPRLRARAAKTAAPRRARRGAKIGGSGAHAPPTGQQTAFGRDFLAGQGVSEMVAPIAVDVHVTLVVGLFAEAQLLDDTPAGPVLGAD